MLTAVGRAVRRWVESVGVGARFIQAVGGASRDVGSWLPQLSLHARVLGVKPGGGDAERSEDIGHLSPSSGLPP